MTRREEVEQRARVQFPAKSEEELSAWIDAHLERHPGFDKLPTNSQADFGALTQQQSRMASRMAEKEKSDAARHGETVALAAETNTSLAEGFKTLATAVGMVTGEIATLTKNVSSLQTAAVMQIATLRHARQSLESHVKWVAAILCVELASIVGIISWEVFFK